MEETILDWNVPNWITVFMMVVLGFAVVGGAVHLFGKFVGTKQND